MTNFTGTASFDPVRRIEISDRVLGGDPASSPINGTLQSLVNRDTYLQSVAAAAAGLAIRYARLAVTGNVSALSGLSTRDGVTPGAGDIILLTAQTTAAQNGLWVAASGAWTRFANANGDTGLPPGCLVSVSEGAINAGTLWLLNTPAPIVVGTTGLAFGLYQPRAMVAMVGKSVSQDIPGGAGNDTKITFNPSPDFDAFALWNASGNRFIAKQAGIHEVGGGIYFDHPGINTPCLLTVWKNGAPYKRVLEIGGSNANVTAGFGGLPVALNVGDYVELYAAVVDDGTWTIGADGDAKSAYFHIRYAGRG
ncbi:hypothetical protein [Methylomagnum ishizawai]|uniref:hypothetical protein n=1 Tax=Methylomagnum ishizawai TaxID=1760988 RepID=UPI001C31FD22|nr:hypothetical protein [Methylomagnum ishizawai]BBL75391.1 hypothetical protein MishRS11D_24890 [Methylomagnum ishizawai]